MKLLSKDGKRAFNLPDKLAQRLVDQGKFRPATTDVEKEPIREANKSVKEAKKPEAKEIKNKGGRGRKKQ